MFKDGKARRNAQGEITVAASYQSRDKPTARIEPHRKWFANSRVISQEALTSFRDAVAERAADPYQVLLKTNKLPMSLIRDNDKVNGLKQHQAKMAIETSPFNDTFGPKAQRKRVKLGVSSLEDLAGETAKMQDTYIEKNDEGTHADGSAIIRGDDTAAVEDLGLLTTSRESVFSKGQSKRIWNELYKVIDSSDVIIHVLDSRDPEGTRCRSVEKYVREEAPHKHLIFVLNKCDLVPTSVAVSFTITILLFLSVALPSYFLRSCVFVFSPCSIAKSRLLPATHVVHARLRSCFSQWNSVCYSFGILTLARTEFRYEPRLTCFRLESCRKGQMCFVFE
jgi:nuclear GTP-binding protein